MKRMKLLCLLLTLAMLASCGITHKIEIPDDVVQITISQYAHPETTATYTDAQSIKRLIDYIEGLSLKRHKIGAGVDSVGWYITVSSDAYSTVYMIDVDDWGRETFREGHTWYAIPQEQCGEWERCLQALDAVDMPNSNGLDEYTTRS